MSSLNLMGVNCNCYAAAISANAQTITLTPEDAVGTSVIEIENPSLTAGVFLLTSGGAAVTPAVFPTAGANGQKPGKYIGPGKSMSYMKGLNHQFISVIGSGADTPLVYISVGTGE